ncbi:hypothetical protein HanPSC8_Chr17g0791911 [Helianthus annuus]|nr:hypothetical protein HanPSC8_Chr17g0791911 [Helianthus annuus]
MFYFITDEVIRAVGATPANYGGGGQVVVLGLPQRSAVVIVFKLFWLGSGF